MTFDADLGCFLGPSRSSMWRSSHLTSLRAIHQLMCQVARTVHRNWQTAQVARTRVGCNELSNMKGRHWLKVQLDSGFCTAFDLDMWAGMRTENVCISQSVMSIRYS